MSSIRIDKSKDNILFLSYYSNKSGRIVAQHGWRAPQVLKETALFVTLIVD